MATKKQKREAAQAKHQKFMESERLSGLAAQVKDKVYRERRRQALQEEADAIDRRAKAIIAKNKIVGQP